MVSLILYFPDKGKFYREQYCRMSEIRQMCLVVNTNQRGYLTFDTFLIFDRGFREYLIKQITSKNDQE